MSFVLWVEEHVRSIIVVMVALALGGVAAAFSLPVGLFPQVQFPRVLVTVDAGDRPADQMALLVTRPIEQAIRQVPGVRDVNSGSTRGSAQISLDFGWGRDMVTTALEVDARMAQVLPSLPPGTTYTVRRMDPTTFPIIAYAMTSNTLTPAALRDLAQYQISPLLLGVAGVANVDVQGGATQEIQVLVDPHLLASYGLALSDVANSITSANVLSAVGHIEDHDKLYLVVSSDVMHQIDEVRNVVVKGDPHGIVRVSDLAKVVQAPAPEYIKVVEDGKPAVIFQVYEQPDGNSVQIADDVRAKLAGFKLPPGVKLANWYDQSRLVVQSAASVRDAVLIGLVLAGLVLYGFLRSFRATLIAIIVVPAVLATTVLLLAVLGSTFNIMTLGGIAAAVGLVIDDVIVMVEQIARRAGATDGSGGRNAVLPAAREFMRPLSGSSLATLIVFLPLSFLTGITGAFSKALSITMASALFVSYLLTAFAVPILARHLIDFTKWHDPDEGRETRLRRTHRRMLDGMFRRPYLVLIGIVPLLVVGWFAYTNVGTGFMPKMDEGGFIIDYKTDPGTSLAETDNQLSVVEKMLKSIPDVDTFSRRTGLGLGGGDVNEPNQGDFFVRLKESGRRPIEQVMAEVDQKISDLAPGVDHDVAQLMEDLIGDLTAVPQPIQIKLFSSDPKQLIPEASDVASVIGNVKGVTDVDSGVVLAGDDLNVQVDQAKAEFEGLDPNAVTTALNAYMTGTIATQLPQAEKQIDVRVWVPPALRHYDSDLAALPIRADDGHLVPLSRVASITTETGLPEIDHDNLKQMFAVTGRIEGRDLGSTVADIKKVLDRPGFLRPGVSYELGGLYQQQQLAFAAMTKVFIAALVAELALLLFLYERIWLPLIIIGSSLLSTTAVFMGLWATGVELNITAIMGMTMIVGIATEMAIFYVSEYTELLRVMAPLDALREASRNRLRPIAMTTLAAILTLMPLALAIGQGSGMQQPLAIAIISGLILQFPLVLLAMPVMISLTLPRAQRRGGTAAAAHEA